MRDRISRVWWIAPMVVLAAVGGARAGAEPETTPGARPSGTLTLAEAIRLGLERNPGLAAARADAAAAGAGARQAEAGRWPRAYAEAGWRRTDNQVLVFGDTLTAGEFTAADFALDRLNQPDAQSHGSAALGLELPLFTSGRIGSGIDAAREEDRAATARLRAAEAGLVAAVTEAYLGVFLARAAVGVASAALDDARAHEASAAARHEAGAALQSDLLRARVARLERERDLVRRRADTDVALSRLRAAIGLAPGEAVEPTEAPVEPEADPAPLDDWIGRAVRSRPEIEAARRDALAARAAARSARSSLGPEAVAAARYERNAAGLDGSEGSFLVGIGIRWSAFDRGRAARIEAGEARARAAEHRARSVADGVALEVEIAWSDALVAARNLRAAREAAAAADEARRIGAERYAAGLLPLTDLLDMETALVRARLAERAALHDAVVGRVRLKRSAGVLEAPR